MLVLVAHSIVKLLEIAPQFSWRFPLSHLIGSSCICTEKVDRLNLISVRAKFMFHSLKSKWAPLTDHGRLFQNLFRSCLFLKENKKTLFLSCSILIGSFVNQTLLRIIYNSFMLIILIQQILPTKDRLDSFLASTSSATNSRSKIWCWNSELSISLRESIKVVSEKR